MNIIFIKICEVLLADGSLRTIDSKNMNILNKACEAFKAPVVALFSKGEPRRSMDFVSGWLYGSGFYGKVFGVVPDVAIPYMGYGKHVISGTSIQISGQMQDDEASIYAWYIMQHIPAKSFGNIAIVSNGGSLGSLKSRHCVFSFKKICSMLKKDASDIHFLIDTVKTEPFQL